MHSTHHLDLEKRVGAVFKKVPSLPRVDPDNTQQQLPTQAQRHGRLALSNDVLYIIFQVGREDVLLVELALEVGGEPDTRQRAGLGQERFGVEHVGDDAVLWVPATPVLGGSVCRSSVVAFAIRSRWFVVTATRGARYSA